MEHDKKKTDEDEKAVGDVLGVSDSPAYPKLPHPPSDGSTPRGIEVGKHDKHRGHDSDSKGATGIDMGAGGSGTDVSPKS